jgi:predicted restriction endonuclease
MAKDLNHYLARFRALRVDRAGGHARPHKVCLLLAVMDMIAEGSITENRILFDDELKDRFSAHFRRFGSGSDVDNPSQPFFYLESSGFWHHQPNPEHEDEYRQRITARKHGGPGVVARIIEYAYLDPELFDLIHGAVARAALSNALLENLDDMGRRFRGWAKAIGKSDKTIANYLGAIGGSISNWMADAGMAEHGLLEITSYREFSAIAQQARRLKKFKDRDSKGKGMYSAALKLYGEFLADITQHEAEEDIQELNRDPGLDPTEKEILISSRIGQGQFRESLINFWGRCAVTGYGDFRLLVASHIKPWRAADNFERLDLFNGVLLLPNLDKAFDRGFISFTEYGNILISRELEDREVIGIKDDMGLILESRHQDYMAHHRERVFRI